MYEMSFIIILLSCLANGATRTWTIDSFTKNCNQDQQKKFGVVVTEIIQKTVDNKKVPEKIHLTCKVNDIDASSAWFSYPNERMQGWLELQRNHLEHLIMQNEYDIQGKVIKTFYHLKASKNNPDKPEFLFVFDQNKNLSKGVIRLGRITYVQTESGLTFKDGQKIDLKKLKDEMDEHFHKDFGLKIPTPNLHALVHSVWSQQNSSTSTKYRKEDSRQ